MPGVRAAPAALVLVLAACSSSGTTAATATTSTAAAAPATTTAAFVLDLHGYQEPASIEVLFSGLGPFGDQHGFVAISPETT